MTQIRVGNGTLSNSPYGYQNDLDIRWRSGGGGGGGAAPRVISATDVYERPATTRDLFVKAEEQSGKKFDQASTLLKQIVKTDKADFQAWTALGSIYFARKVFRRRAGLSACDRGQAGFRASAFQSRTVAFVSEAIRRGG